MFELESRCGRRTFLKVLLASAVASGATLLYPEEPLKTLIYYPGIGGVNFQTLEKTQEQAKTSGFNLTLADVPRVNRPGVRAEYIAAAANQIRNHPEQVSLLGSSLGGGGVLMLLDSERLTFQDGGNRVDTTYLSATRNLFNPDFASEINYQDQAINAALKDFYRVIKTPENILNNANRIVIAHGRLDEQVRYPNSQSLDEVFKQSGRCKLISFDTAGHMDIVSDPDLLRRFISS